MTHTTGKRRHHFKNTIPTDPAIIPLAQWSTPNRSFHHSFYQWLKSGGYSPSALNTYSVAARLAMGYLNKLYWMIDPDADIELVHRYIEGRSISESTKLEYKKGLRKLVEYLRLRQNKAARLPGIHWEHYLNSLPDWMSDHVRDFIAHKQKGWRPEDRHRCTLGALSPLCQALRWIANATRLNSVGDITPQVWYDYVDACLVKNRHVNIINNHLFRLRAFLHFLDEGGFPICQRMLLFDPLKSGPRLPKDAPIAQLRSLLSEIEREASAEHSSRKRFGALDRAWSYLMLYSGLRTCEVRRLRLTNIDWESRRIRIEQSKGLKDRLAYMNSATAEAVQAWLGVRENAEYISDHVFVYCHKPLSRRYCGVRLRTYGKRCGTQITPHQLRHSCATLLLNAGAPVISVQALLGHKKIDTTLGYARLYDCTLASDYYRAMGQIERLFVQSEGEKTPAITPATLITLLDSLSKGTLNQNQRKTLQALRAGILTWVTNEQIKA
jgi:site-specific recombinase XerD